MNAHAKQPYEIVDEATFKWWRTDQKEAHGLLKEIIFRWRGSHAIVPGKSGHFAAWPIERWCEWAHLSRDQVERRLKQLVDMKLIERERHRFAGTEVRAFLRPTALALRWMGRPEEKAAAGTSAGTSAASDYTTYATLTTSSIKATPSNCVLTDAEMPEKSEGGTQETIIPGEMNKPAPKFAGVSLDQVWQNAVSEAFPNDILILTAQDVKNLKNLDAKYAKTALAGYLGDVLDYALKDWYGFTCAAKSYQSAFDLPKVPSVGFFTKYHTSASAVWMKPNGLKIADGVLTVMPSSPAALPKKPTPKTAALPKKPVTKMTSAELWADPTEDDPE